VQVTFSRAAGPASPRIQLDDETLATVSRAIMGRLDVVDLVGRNTSQEVAERVAEALLDPLTTERLKAVRR
jgi:cell division protease FtsH